MEAAVLMFPLALVRACFGGSVALIACGGHSGESSASRCSAGEVCVTGDAPDGGSTPPYDGATDAEALVPDGSEPPPPGYPPGSVPPTSSSLHMLDYQVVDAQFSEPLSSLVLVSAAPANALHIYDTKTNADRSIALPAAPVAVALDASGLKAAIAYDGHVSWVDLASATVTGTCPITSDAFEVALSKEGVAYVMPKTDQWVPVHVVDATCKEIAEERQVYASSHMELDPSETALFTADQIVNRCHLEISPMQCERASPVEDGVVYDYCGNLWFSADGKRIFTACGVTLNVSSAPAFSCTHAGSLAGTAFIRHLSEAPQATRIALLLGDRYGDPNGTAASMKDAVVLVYETNSLGFVTQLELPAFPVSVSATPLPHGRFVFSTPTMNQLFVVVQAEAPNGLLLKEFAVVTMEP